MPHIKLEYTHNIEFEKEPAILLENIIKILVYLIKVKHQNCRGRIFKLQNYSSHNHNGFIHLEISIIEGRNQNIKKKAAYECIEIIKSIVKKEVLKNVQISIEFRDVSKQKYFSNTL